MILKCQNGSFLHFGLDFSKNLRKLEFTWIHLKGIIFLQKMVCFIGFWTTILEILALERQAFLKIVGTFLDILSTF